MRKMTKKLQKQFHDRCHALLKELGCKSDKTNWYQYTLDTIYGELRLTVEPGEYCLTLFTRFNDPDKVGPAVPYNDYNHCSGKWNFHLTVKDIDTIISELSRALKAVLPETEKSSESA